MKTTSLKIIGPFSQIVTMEGLPLKGPIKDEALPVFSQAGVKVCDGVIQEIKDWRILSKERGVERYLLSEPCVLLPGFVDAHTHICYAGSRARDYALRMRGATYQEIAASGGGILDTVKKTREASPESLSRQLKINCDKQLKNGVTTCEVKSGYGLTVDDEIKMLQVIRDIDQTQELDLVATCLAAHVLPPEFSDPEEYLKMILQKLLPVIKKEKLATRVDIFVEHGAFTEKQARVYLREAKLKGFDVVVHADQFSTGGSQVACSVNALAAEHLEVSQEQEISLLAKHNVAAVVLPGASLGLGLPFAPARKILDQGVCLVIASDFNPGSAPMGDLLTQASLMGMNQKLTTAEIFASITCRAAHTLKFQDRGTVSSGQLADMIAFPCADYQEILYHQGQMKPCQVWKAGQEGMGNRE